MGRQIRAKLPVEPTLLEPKWPDMKKIRQRGVLEREKIKNWFSKRHRCQELSDLQLNEKVWVTDLRKYGKIIQKIHDRSYVISIDGTKYWRNRDQREGEMG